jgi:hypothetical protein
MIRRLGDDGSSTSITYFGSTCTQIDPVSGLCVADVTLADPSNAGGSGAAGVGMPADPGAQAALDAFAASAKADANSLALNRSLTASGNMGIGLVPIDSPLSLPISIANPLNKYLLYGAVAIVALYMVTESNSSAARRRR